MARYASLKPATDPHAAPAPTPWLWPNRIPAAALTLLVGQPGIGKSLLAADIAARTTTNNQWPDQSDSPTARRPGHVLIISAEDAFTTCVAPRLIAAGADMDRVSFIRGAGDSPDLPPESPFFLCEHLEALYNAVAILKDPALIVLDTLTTLLAPRTALHEIPASFAPNNREPAAAVAITLTRIARRFGVAILAISHTTKRRSSSAILNSQASMPFLAVARAAHLLTADPLEPAIRRLTPIKSALTKPPPQLAFQINDAPAIDWRPPSSHAPLQIPDRAAEVANAVVEAAQWLQDMLESGPKPAREILRGARENAISLGAIRRAKQTLSIRSRRPDHESGWLWSIPDPSDNKGAQTAGAHNRAPCAPSPSQP